LPIDPQIRRLAEDPEVISVIEILERFFEGCAKTKDIHPVLAFELTAAQMVEEYWRMIKRGTLRLKDDGDHDGPLIQETVTPGERARARHMGAILFAVRQHIRRAARRAARLKAIAPRPRG
jgi:hypothetical protein